MSVIELHQKNTGDYLKENITLSLSRFGIELNQILTITTDNGSNMLRMANLIDSSVSAMLDSSNNLESDEYSDGDSEALEVNLIADEDDVHNLELQVEEEGNVVRKVTSVRCAAHCLQLAVKDACQDLQEFLEQIRQIVRKLRTPNMSLRLKQQKLPQAVIDMPVRWDSTADMLERLQKLKTFCIQHFEVSADTWSNLDKYLDILQPCRYLSKILQKEELTIGDFYIAWMRCRHQITQMEDPFARHLESCMINREKNLFENDHFVATIYMDPRVKSILTPEQIQSARIYLTSIYKRIVLLNESRLESTSEQGTSSQSNETGLDSTAAQGTSSLSNQQSFEVFLRQQFTHVTDIQDASNTRSLEREINFKLTEFFQEPPLSADHNLLQYWENKKITDPLLYKLAKVVLATPPTSVSVERLFSSLKFVLNNLRMRLDDSIIDDVMIVRNNHLYTKQ